MQSKCKSRLNQDETQVRLKSLGSRSWCDWQVGTKSWS